MLRVIMYPSRCGGLHCPWNMYRTYGPVWSTVNLRLAQHRRVRSQVGCAGWGNDAVPSHPNLEANHNTLSVVLLGGETLSLNALDQISHIVKEYSPLRGKVGGVADRRAVDESG